MYSSCSIALIANCRPMHKIEQTTTGAISVIRQKASARDCSDQTADSLAAAVPFSHRSRQRTAGTACRRTARRSGSAGRCPLSEAETRRSRLTHAYSYSTDAALLLITVI